MTDFDESAVHRQVLDGDPRGLEALVRQLGPRVYRLAQLALGRVGTPQDAEEVAGDAFAAAWRRIGEYDPARASLTGWVLMLTKYAALERRRRLLRRDGARGQAGVGSLALAPEPVAEAGTDEAMLRREELENLHLALRRLPELERELVVRRYYFGDSIADLAVETGLSRGAVDTRLWRARATLKALMSEGREVGSDGT